jgi:tRNA dimethylallyltransferase
MLYFNALTQGLATLPEANPEIRAKLEQDLALYGKQAA